MRSLYQSPLRVYLILGTLALWGVLSSLSLSTSLFPNNSQPEFLIRIPYGNLSAKQFVKDHGMVLESQIKSFRVHNIPVEKVEANYGDRSAKITVTFAWGGSSEEAKKELQTLINSISSSWPEISRRDYSLQTNSESQGFFAVNFFSTTRSLDEIFQIIDPILSPTISALKDVGGYDLINPNKKSLIVELNPEKMAQLQVTVQQVITALNSSLMDQNGGAVSTGERNLSILIPSTIKSIFDLRQIPIKSSSGATILLQQVAYVSLQIDKKQQKIFRTNGTPSVILFASPSAGGNIKRMSDQIIDMIEKMKTSLPSDIQTRVLVNPSEFITASIHSVFHEVVLAALLSVVVLFLFIGSIKNVATAAIEIPLSIIMAFILMYLTGMNLNLISLGGLALSAGMNVDASVVVMENIFRHFSLASSNSSLHDKNHSFLSSSQKLELLIKAVNEVKLPIIASTIASLVVFIPLITTHGLTNAILGDLAKAVVFSHGLSAFVALILVPTVRLQMLKNETEFHIESPIEKWMIQLEKAYRSSLSHFINEKKVRQITYTVIISLLIILVGFIFPRLPKEIIGQPDTDWIILGATSPTFNDIKVTELFFAELERDLLEQFETHALYTFTQITGANRGMIMLKLKDKKQMDLIWKQMEAKYKNSPTIYYWINPWNPSEMPIPNPPHFKINIVGGSPEKRKSITDEIMEILQQNQVFPRIWSEPNTSKMESVQLNLRNNDINFSPASLSYLSKIATEGQVIGSIELENQSYDLRLSYPEGRVKSIEELSALPIGLDGNILPLKALTDIQIKNAEPAINRINQRDLSIVYARENKSNLKYEEEDKKKAQDIIYEYLNKKNNLKRSTDDPLIEIADPATELTDSISQLKMTVLISIFLIFVTMVLQFGDLAHAFLVMISIPLGIIGVALALFMFNSTLSLNSILGVILLNGISVANSIILVDYMKRLVDQGLPPKQAALDAAETRLRPILMTSLTTCLGMLPVAFGMGEGGKILQPLGISVAGGLWFSMILTLFIVPTLQVQYLEWKQSQNFNLKNWFIRKINMRKTT